MTGRCNYTNTSQLSSQRKSKTIVSAPTIPINMAIVIELSARLTTALTRWLGTQRLTTFLTRWLGTQTRMNCSLNQQFPDWEYHSAERYSSLRDYRQVGGVGSEPCVLTRWLQRTMTEIADFAALASTETNSLSFPRRAGSLNGRMSSR